VTLPPALVAQLAAWRGAGVRSVTGVGGGCISNTTRVEFVSGDRAFLKWAPRGEQPDGFFAEQARSLRALGDTHTVRVPNVLACEQAGEFSWLLLEWLEPGRGSAASDAALGRQLAALHRHTADAYGWATPNFIGSLPQANTRQQSWPDFWREERLIPQLRRASHQLSASERRRLDALCAACGELLAGTDADGASLLHGDLWSGNVLTLADGSPAVIDPASYYGHREVDLAMARLFGGFGDAFFGAYEEAWPCGPGAEPRVHMYQLYYLLVHVNLFGGAYRGQTMSAVARLGF
jgi:fructosamine-3-kinase